MMSVGSHVIRTGQQIRSITKIAMMIKNGKDSLMVSAALHSAMDDVI